LYKLETGFNSDLAKGGLMLHQLQERQILDLIEPFLLKEYEDEEKFIIQPYKRKAGGYYTPKDPNG